MSVLGLQRPRRRSHREPATATPISLSPDDLAGVMAGVARRDPDAVGRLWEVALPHLRRMVRQDLEGAGFRPSRDVVEDAACDACLMLVDRAAQWRPDGGAAPWTWARRSIRSIAFAALGVVAGSLDELVAVAAPEPASGGHAEPVAVLERLAATDPDAAAVLARLRSAGSERDQRIFLRMAEERAAGNRSPAHTVAAEEGMTPAAVRQVACRMAGRMGQLRRHEPPAQQAGVAA